MKLKRIYHHYTNWEEYKFGMWRTIKDEKEKEKLLKEAIKFTGNYKLYGKYMMLVVKQWKYSCEHNLTKSGDKRAWIGHAAVAYAIQCPEDIVREAWGYLTPQQQELANKKASAAIDYWRAKNA